VIATVAGGGTAVLDVSSSLADAPTVAATPSPSTPMSASVRVPPRAAPPTLQSQMAVPSPSGVASGAPAAIAANVPRKTELMARVAANAPRDTVKLEDADGGALWKYDPAVSRSPSAAPIRQAARPAPMSPVKGRSAFAAWAPIVLALVASAVILLCLFVWKVL